MIHEPKPPSEVDSEKLEQKRKEMLEALPKLEQKREEVFKEFLEKPEVQEALQILDGLPEHLRYHTKEHTFDVMRETIFFALADDVSDEVMREQIIAAAWHDVGFIEQDKANEPIAVRLFKESRAYENLSVDVREEVMANIRDTAMVVTDGAPKFLKRYSKHGYILDADVSNFGRKDFFEKRDLIMKELGIDKNNPAALKGFYAFTITLLENHDWKTMSARILRQAQKEENIQKAKDEYREYFEKAA